MRLSLLDLYKKDVDSVIEAADEGQKDQLPNPDREHAAVLIEKLFGAAESSIQVLCHRLAGDIYGRRELYKALKKAYQKHPNLDCEIYLRDSYPDSTQVRDEFLAHGAKIVTNVSKVAESMPDMFLVDNKLLRKERSSENREADFFACNQDMQQKAQGHFALLKEKCARV